MLVVEDDADTAEMLQRHLRRVGIKSEIVASAGEARRVISEFGRRA